MRAAESILVCLAECPMSTADIVFELDFNPSTVYSTLSELTAGNFVERHRNPTGRGSYSITSRGMERVEKLSLAGFKHNRPVTEQILDAVAAGATTYKEIVAMTNIERVSVMSSMQSLLRDNKTFGVRMIRTDSAGKGGRGGSTIARFAISCR